MYLLIFLLLFCNIFLTLFLTDFLTSFSCAVFDLKTDSALKFFNEQTLTFNFRNNTSDRYKVNLVKLFMLIFVSYLCFLLLHLNDPSSMPLA